MSSPVSHFDRVLWRSRWDEFMEELHKFVYVGDLDLLAAVETYLRNRGELDALMALQGGQSAAGAFLWAGFCYGRGWA